MSRPESAARGVVSRRTTLRAVAATGAVVAGWTLVGCEQDTRRRGSTGATAESADPTDPDPADPSTGPSSGPDAASSGETSGEASDEVDVRLLGERVVEVEELAALVAATRRRHRRLRPALGPFDALHEAHRAVLDEAGEHDAARSGPAPRVPRRADRALAALLRREQRHAQALADAAVEASSGGFARLLASMAAGVEQHLAEVSA